MRTYKAFVSSTQVDLREHRLYIIDALRKAGFHVDPMEDWPADADEPKQFSQERVDGCHLCILVFALRRGHVPDGEAESITQMEYRYARKQGIDVLPFLLQEDAPWARKFDESRDDPAVLTWRSELKEQHGVGYFSTLPQTIQIHPALTRWVMAKKEREGPNIFYWIGRPGTLGQGFVGRKEDIDGIIDAFQ